MSIKNKRTGPAPNYSERWQSLATDHTRLADAIREYRIRHPNSSAVDATRAVRQFHEVHVHRHVLKR